MKKALLLLTFFMFAVNGFSQSADIVVTNTNNQSVYVAGTDVTYTVTVTNFGPAVATNVVVENPLPTGITSSFWEGSNNSFGSNTGLFNTIATLPVGGYVTYVINISIPVAFTGNLVSTATANAASPVDNFLTSNKVIDTDIVANADISVVNTDNSLVYTSGEDTVYTVTITNNGPTDAVNVIVKNDHPMGITPAQFLWVGSNGTSGTDKIDDLIPLLANGTTVVYTITIHVPGTFSGSLINKTTIFATSKDSTEADWVSTDTDVKSYGADVIVTNTDNQNFYVPGQPRIYTLKVSNAGPEAATGIHITNALPVGVTVMSWTASNGTNGTGPLDVTLPTLANNAEVTYTVTVQVPTGFSGDLVSQAVVTSTSTDPNPGCNSTCIDTDTAGADIVITNTNNQTEYIAGSIVTYVVTMTNNGPNAAQNVSVSDTFTAGTIVSWTGSNGTNGGGSFNDVIATLANGAIVTYTIKVQLPNNLTADLVSQVVVSSDTSDPSPACLQCIDTDVSKKADLQVTYTDNKVVYVPGTSNVYEVTIINNGPGTAENISVSNLIPTGVTQFSWTGSNGSVGTNVPLSDIIPVLANGATVTYTITLVVPTTYTTALTNTLKITSATTDPTPVVQIVDVDNVTAIGADIVVTNTNGQTTYLPGTTTTYTLTVTNNGPEVATGVNVTNALPAGITTMNWTGNSNSGTGALTDNIPSLAVGSSVVYTVTVQIPAGFTTNLISQAATTATTTDPNPACVNCTDTDTPTTNPDIVVTNTSNNSAPVKGTSTTFTVTVTNNGPGDATNVHVENPLPAGVTTMTWTGTNGSTGTGALDNTIAVLPNGTTVIYTVTVSIGNTFTGNLSSTATATVTNDPNTANSTATAIVTPVTGSGIVVTNTDSALIYTAGQDKVYTITVTNAGSVAATNVDVNSVLPAGIPSANYNWVQGALTGSGPINTTIATLAPNQSVVYTITINVPSDFDQHENLVTTVSAGVGTFDPAIATDIDTPKPYADLIIKKTDNKTTFSETRYTDDKPGDAIDPVLVQEFNIYTITVINYGPSEAINVKVTDLIPVNPNSANLPVTQMTWTGSNGSSGTGNLIDITDNLPVGATVTYTVKVLVPEKYNLVTPYSNFVNTATVVSETEDPTTSNNNSVDVDTPASNFLFVSNDPTVYSVNGTLSGLAQGYVENVLVRSHCAEVSNFQMVSAPGNASYGIGYFNRNNSDFPIKDGIVLAAGRVTDVPGPSPGYIDSSLAWPGDTNFDPGYMTPDVGIPVFTTHNASYLQFDFLPSTSELSFNFAFAADEYDAQGWQCRYSDVFAFILTDNTAGTQPTNLAVVPNTTTPVKVTNIRPAVPGVDCPAVNEAYFGKYNKTVPVIGGFDAIAAKSPIKLDGQTRVMQAKSAVIPGHLYTIKLVIANYDDGAIPPAVFIEGGSFAFGAKITGDGAFADQDDFGEGREVCDGEVRRIKFGDPVPGAVYSWTKNGVKIEGATNNYLDVDSSGIYTASVTFATGCKKSDDIQVLFTDPLPIGEPADRNICSETAPYHFNIDQDSVILDGLPAGTYGVTYYENYDDAFNMAPNFITNLTDYIINTDAELGKTIYASIENLLVGTNCPTVKPFKLNAIYKRGTISYPTGPFCVGAAGIDVINSADLSPGGVYIATPSGLDIDPVTGHINLIGSTINTYSVVYTIAADVCPLFSTPAVTVVVEGCVSTTMLPIANVCPSDVFSLSTSDAGTGATYTWSDASGVIGTTNVPTLTGLTASATSGSYTYSVIATLNGIPSPSSSQILTVNPIPQATISGPLNVCTAASVNITFTGTPNAHVTYTDGSGTAYPVQLDATGTKTVSIASVTVNTTYQITDVALDITPSCAQTIAAGSPGSSLTVTVGEPDATVSIANPVICSGTPATFTITGTQGGSVTYTIVSGGVSTPGTAVLDPVTGLKDVVTPNLTAAATITLNNITSAGSSSCSKVLNATASVTVNPLPSASFTAAAATVCSGTAPAFTFTGTPNATVTLSDGTATYTAVLDTAGSATVTTPVIPAITAGTTYTLQTVVSSGTVPCSATLTQSVVIGINELAAVVTDPPAPANPVCIGTSFTLTAVATGTNITYEWHHIDAGGTDQIVGGNLTNYTEPSASTADGGGYYVIVSNSCGPATSAVATVVISEPTVITPLTGSGAVCAGQPVHLSITATGVGLTYQWYRTTAAGTQALTGQTNTTLDFTASAATAGSYTCVVSNSCGPVTSNAVVITVDELPLITNITTVPPLCTGGSFNITVTATGTGLTYKWFHGTTQLAETSETYPVPVATLAHAGTYHVEVSGTCAPDAISTDVIVVVNQAPAFTQHPTTATPVVCSGQPLQIDAQANAGAGAVVTYQWFQDGNILAGETGASLIIPATEVSDSGSYSVVASNANCAPVSSNTVVITVNQAPVFTLDPKSESICEGKNITLEAFASGTNLTYEWFKNGISLGTGTGNTYPITSAQIADSGNYTCVVSNTSCPPVTSQVAVIFVNALPDAAITNGDEAEICAGYTTEVKITGTKNAVVSYTVNGGPVQTKLLDPNGEGTIPTGKIYEDATYELVSVTLGSAPFCEADLSGLPTSIAVVTVHPLPVVELDQDGYICVDSVTGATTKTFTFETGLDAAQYDIAWFLDGVDTGVTGADYIADKAGAYRVEVTDRVTGCYAEAKAPVVSSSPPVTVTAEVVTNYFDENGTVVVTVEPAGDYEYRLDDGPWQESNVFTNVRTLLTLDQTGTHRLYARDLKACDEKYADVTVIDYPKYFTPNGDGYHDTWNIPVLSNQPSAKIFIFDRFGKLLKQISTTGAGWDGTFNGQPMPGDDYWFVLKYSEKTVNKEFKAHFALKR